MAKARRIAYVIVLVENEHKVLQYLALSTSRY